MNSERGGMKVALGAVIAVAAIAGIAGAVILRGSHSDDLAQSAAPVQGSSFSEASASGATAPPAAAASAVVATPAPVSAAAAASGTPVAAATSAAETKPATAADIPADIASIPSATPVPPKEIASVAGGSPPPQPPSNEPPANPADYKDINFTVLAGYKYIEPVPQEGAKPEETEAQRKKNQIPADVVALNKSRAVVEGWMVPMQVDDNGGVKSFVLVKTQPQCCFGDTQKMNEWIDVTMPAGKTAEFNVDRPVKVYGTLEVGEKIEDGFVLSVYRMQADKVSG